MNRNTQALKQIAIALAALVYCGAVLYGDIMFISVMHEAFPTGLMGTLATAGAVMTAVSAITLPLALHYWFAPGMQFVWGIIFWLLDIVALSLNAILAYNVATGQADPWVMQWQQIAPATPMLAVIGWGLAFLLDPSHKLRHAQAELDADLIDIHAAQLRSQARSEGVIADMEANARATAAHTAERLTGTPAPKQLPRIIDGNSTSAPAQPTDEAGKTATAPADNLAWATIQPVTEPQASPNGNHHGPKV